MNCQKFLLAIAVMAAMTEVISSQPEPMQPELLSEQEIDSVGSAQLQDNADELEELPNNQRSRRQAVAQPTVYTSWWQLAPTSYNRQPCYYYYFYIGTTRWWYYVCFNANNQQTYYYAPAGTPQQPLPSPPLQPRPMPPTVPNYGNTFKNFFRRKFGA